MECDSSESGSLMVVKYEGDIEYKVGVDEYEVAEDDDKYKVGEDDDKYEIGEYKIGDDDDSTNLGLSCLVFCSADCDAIQSTKLFH